MSGDPGRHLPLKLVALAIGMFGFGYAMVPLYHAFGALTGSSGRVASANEQVTIAPDAGRTIRVEFTSSVAPSAPFELDADVGHLDIHPGELYTALFHGKNLLNQPVTARAVPSVAPGEAADYLRKVSCFCFTPQPFGAGETRELPVVFMVDPKFPEYLDTMTLSYTLYRAPTGSAQSSEE